MNLSLIIPPLILIFIAAFLFVENIHKRKIRKILLEYENTSEEISILKTNIDKEKNLHTFLKQKITRYESLKDLLVKMNETVKLQDVTQALINYVFFWIGREKGICRLYLVERQKKLLRLFSSKKEDKNLVIKEKQGDIFDNWVLKHSCSLLVESLKSDFRFDQGKANNLSVSFASLVNSPLKVKNKFLGLLRMENCRSYFYSQDDLRFLDTICHVGAIGIENALFFQETSELAIRDTLTSLYTKGYFLEYLNNEILPRKGVINLLMLDIDHFKDYNDRYGHIAGDIVLKGIAKILEDFFINYHNCKICRFGGEEFCVTVPDKSKRQTQELAEQLRERIRSHRFYLRKTPTNITVSLGLAAFPEDGNDSKTLIYKSDSALYKAKEEGRDRIVCA
ncbi:MAG: diguanylate cyclase [Candidatus Omnitrophica bacterium]|nr:diguanylate cyclase [Candidatus Omnitrophota bacterium]